MSLECHLRFLLLRLYPRYGQPSSYWPFVNKERCYNNSAVVGIDLVVIVDFLFLDTVQGEQAAMRSEAANPNNNSMIRPQHRELRSLLSARDVWVL